ncbi:MAG: RNA polymerase sigma factor [Polyangiales bacterium]|nr:sigma-70 family RNA polymerase sigma factor [Myxococcales bacterium]
MHTHADPAAQLLVDQHRALLSFVQSRVGDRALAEEILQDAFVRALPKLDSIREEESTLAWFYRVLRNAIVDHHRRRTRASRALDAFASEVDAHVEPTPEVAEVVCRCVSALAADLDPKYAEAIRRVDLDGLAVKDFATEIGITANNAGVRIHRARKALAARVARSCGTCAEHGCLDCTCHAS